MAEYDLVVRNGTLATASDVFRADIGVIDGRVVTIGAKVGAGRREIDAEGRIVTPGGIDSHCHIAQRSSMGVMTADDFFTATRSAACGGTTTALPFPAPSPRRSPHARRRRGRSRWPSWSTCRS